MNKKLKSYSKLIAEISRIKELLSENLIDESSAIKELNQAYDKFKQEIKNVI